MILHCCLFLFLDSIPLLKQPHNHSIFAEITIKTSTIPTLYYIPLHYIVTLYIPLIFNTSHHQTKILKYVTWIWIEVAARVFVQFQLTGCLIFNSYFTQIFWVMLMNCSMGRPKRAGRSSAGFVLTSKVPWIIVKTYNSDHDNDHCK